MNLEIFSDILSDQDFGFLLRINKSHDLYSRRLKQIGFEGFRNVLDAGCGFGQWTLHLARTNERITAIDLDSTRLLVSQDITDSNGLKNVSFRRASVDSLPYKDASFDAIFCYSVLYLAKSYPKAFLEFARVLKPGGKLYFTTNAIGRTLYHIMRNPHATPEFSPRRNGVKALLKAVTRGVLFPNSSTIMFPSRVCHHLENAGFIINHLGPEGSLKEDPNQPTRFMNERFYGQLQVFEVMAERRSSSLTS